MLTRDRAYLLMSLAAIIIQATTLPLARHLDESSGFVAFWIGAMLTIAIPTIVVLTSSRPFASSSRDARMSVMISISSLIATLLFAIIAL